MPTKEEGTVYKRYSIFKDTLEEASLLPLQLHNTIFNVYLQVTKSHYLTNDCLIKRGI